jgi:hypothetical protein
MKSFILWDITPGILLKPNRHFEGNFRCSTCCLLHARFLLRLFFGLENGDDIYSRNFG